MAYKLCFSCKYNKCNILRNRQMTTTVIRLPANGNKQLLTMEKVPQLANSNCEDVSLHWQ